MPDCAAFLISIAPFWTDDEIDLHTSSFAPVVLDRVYCALDKHVLHPPLQHILVPAEATPILPDRNAARRSQTNNAEGEASCAGRTRELRTIHTLVLKGVQ